MLSRIAAADDDQTRRTHSTEKSRVICVAQKESVPLFVQEEGKERRTAAEGK